MAIIEFAIIAPLFIMMLVVGSDVTLAMRNRFRLEQASMETMEIVTQYTSLYDSDFTSTLFPIAQQLAGKNPSLGGSLACGITITGIGTGKNKNFSSVAWQKTFGNCALSKIGAVGSVPALPGGYQLPSSGPTAVPMIVVEVNGQQAFAGLTASVIGAGSKLYQVAIAMPRQRVLPSITSGARP